MTGKKSVTITCRDNQASISPTSMTLAVGESKYLSYRHQYSNDYTSAAQAYYSCGSSCISVSSDGRVTALAPGQAYVNLYSKISSTSPACLVTVKEVDVDRATISDQTIDADASRSLSVTVSPSNATVKSKRWEVTEGSEYASVTSDGTLRGIKPGTAKIRCTVNSSVKSNIATVTVREPSFSIKETSPADNAEGVSVFTVPAITYSLTLSESTNFGSVALTRAADSKKIAGGAEISGNSVRFTSTEPLEPMTKYVFSVPADAVKNKWGTSYRSATKLTFTTGSRKTIQLNLTPADGSYLNPGMDLVTISADVPEAKIFYTTNGDTPTGNSTQYTEPFTLSAECTVKAIATAPGYNDSEITSAHYLMSKCLVRSAYPSEENRPYVYAPIVPHIEFSGALVRNSNFRKITLKIKDGGNVEGEPHLQHNVVAFVPDKPLDINTTYILTIPADAVSASGSDETNQEVTHTFTTHNLRMSVVVAGDEMAAMMYQNGQVDRWGRKYNSISASNGAVDYTATFTPVLSMNNVAAFSGGATHLLYLSDAGDLKGTGRQYCGELNQSATASTNLLVNVLSGVKVVSAGTQHTAAIKNDGTLWTWGRNDFGQCGNGTNVKATPTQVLEHVVSVAAGNGFTLAVTEDGKLYAWGRNHKGQLGNGTTVSSNVPVEIMQDVVSVAAGKGTHAVAAAIKSDGSLWMWGDNAAEQIPRASKTAVTAPVQVMANIRQVAIGNSHATAISCEYFLYAWGDNSCGQLPGVTTLMAGLPRLCDTACRHADASDDVTVYVKLDGSIHGSGRNANHLLSAETINSNEKAKILFEGVPYARMESVRLNFSDYYLPLGTEGIAIAKPNPIYADYDTMTWSVTNPKIASISDKGVITPRSTGKTEITVTMKDRWDRTTSAKANLWIQTPEEYVGTEAAMVSPEWSAEVCDGILRLYNLVPGNVYRVYNVAGITIVSLTATSDTHSVALNTKGVYIIHSRDHSVKVINK